jgi:hypothetical protein
MRAIVGSLAYSTTVEIRSGTGAGPEDLTCSMKAEGVRSFTQVEVTYYI